MNNCKLGKQRRLVAVEIPLPLTVECIGCFFNDGARQCPYDEGGALVCAMTGTEYRFELEEVKA